MTDNAWLDYPPPGADAVRFPDWVAANELDLPLGSCLGAGMCQECGRPVDECECFDE